MKQYRFRNSQGHLVELYAEDISFTTTHVLFKRYDEELLRYVLYAAELLEDVRGLRVYDK